MKSPKAPKPTEAEIQLQNRQREDTARLDEEENLRLKRGQRARLGGRAVRSSGSAYLGAAPAARPSGPIPGAGAGGYRGAPSGGDGPLI